MLTAEPGEAGAEELQTWAQHAAGRMDPGVGVTADFDPDSNTYVLRLSKGARVLIFRLSPAQVHTGGREAFSQGSDTGKTRAHPDIWAKPDEFQMKMANFEKAAEALGKAAAATKPRSRPS